MTERALPSFGLTEWERTSDQGVVAKRVDRFSSLGKAGVQVGDVLLAINDTALAQLPTPEALMAHWSSLGVGATALVRLLRDGQPLTVPVVLVVKKVVSLDLEEIDASLERKIAPAARFG
jgi:S1-C subfamily serine protease